MKKTRKRTVPRVIPLLDLDSPGVRAYIEGMARANVMLARIERAARQQPAA